MANALYTQSARRGQNWIFIFRQLRNKKHLKKCWAHSPLRAAARHRLRIDVHNNNDDDDDDDNDSA